MTGFLIGLAAGLVLAAMILLLLDAARRRGVRLFSDGPATGGYRKVMVATVGRAFDRAAIDLAARMSGGDGIIETVYVVEFPLNRPLESGAEAELGDGMDALEEASRVGKASGAKPIPRLERSRLGSKSIVELQRNEGFDAVVLSVSPGKRSEREGRKIADYVLDHADCAVVILSPGVDASPEEAGR